MKFATLLFPRTLARKFTLRDALSSDFKHPSRFITSHSFASQRQMMVNIRSEVVIITKNRSFSTEQINQNSSKNNNNKLSPKNIAPKQIPISAPGPFEQNKLEFSTQKTNEYKKSTLPAFPLVLIFTTSAIICLGLYRYFFSAVYKYPDEIRKNLRKGLYYQNYRNDPNRAVNYYQMALTEAFNHAELDNASPEVTGIMIQLGGLYEELGRIRDATNVFTMAYDAIVTPNNIPAKLDGKIKLRAVGLAQKLGDLHQSLKQDEQAEKYYIWSIEQLLQSQSEVAQSNQDRDGLFSKKLDMVLPSWMTFTDLGASLEALAVFYSSRQKYAYALPLYLRALSLIDPPESSCHSAVLMNNISEVFTRMNNFEEARGWAERGLKLVENFKKKKTRECDESCGVLLFNLGMISELSGNTIKACEYYEKARDLAKKINFSDCVNEADLALKRINKNVK